MSFRDGPEGRTWNQGVTERLALDSGFALRAPRKDDIGAVPAIDGFVRPWDGRWMPFEILGEISGIETFATGAGIRERARLRKVYGRGRWRKRKGTARIRLADGSVHLAELHWYEAAGIGRKEFKIKHLL